MFVALGPLSPECYLEHGIPTMNATVTGTVAPGSAQNFSLTPPSTAYDPIQLAVLDKQGVFKGKKVAVFGETADAAEVKVVDSALAKDHVNVVLSAIDSAPTTDGAASAQQQQIIAQKFQSAGANEVVAVGTGSASWFTYEQQNQSTFNPPWVATSWSDLDGTLTGNKSRRCHVPQERRHDIPDPLCFLASGRSRRSSNASTRSRRRIRMTRLPHRSTSRLPGLRHDLHGPDEFLYSAWACSRRLPKRPARR